MKLTKHFYVVLASAAFSLLLNVAFGIPSIFTFAGGLLVSYAAPALMQGSLNSAFLILNNVNEREVFNQAQASLANAFQDTPGFDVRNYKLTQSFLRSEVALAAGSTLYRFNILQNQTQPQPFNTEKRLHLQDAFVISQLAFFISAPASATDAEALPLTYPDPLVFTGGSAPDTNALYNGSLSITVNNNVLTPAWDLFRHLYVPATQGAAGPPVIRTEQSGFDGFFPMEPNIVLVGSKNNQIAIELPAGIVAPLANSRAILFLRGILAQNSTVVS